MLATRSGVLSRPFRGGFSPNAAHIFVTASWIAGRSISLDGCISSIISFVLFCSLVILAPTHLGILLIGSSAYVNNSLIEVLSQSTHTIHLDVDIIRSQN